MKYVTLPDIKNQVPVFDDSDELCDKCSYTLDGGQCLSCNIFKKNRSFTGGKFHFKKILSSGRYKHMRTLNNPEEKSEDNLSWLILNYKREDKLLKYCADLMKLKMEDFLLENDLDKNNILVCPVPDYENDKYQKGELLAKNLSEKIGISYLPLLKKTKETEKQHKVKGENILKSKFDNVNGAFEMNAELLKNIKGKNIFLVDDIVSSMASINECSKILKENGAKDIYVFCLGRTILLPKTGEKIK